MKTVKRQTESFLFESSGLKFRAIPFYELSFEEWIIYENGHPKYLLDFNRQNEPLIQDLKVKLNQGEELENLVCKLGQFLGKEWTTKHNIKGTEIQDSQQIETIELNILDDLSELFIDLYFVATDFIDYETLLNEDKLFETYLTDDLGIESAYINNFDNLNLLLNFVFKTKTIFTELASNNYKQIFDLTQYKQNFISTSELESNYQEWIKNSNRENTMDEYANLIGIINYIDKNIKKKNLLLITEKRKHWN
jgi:hypothetical protein